MKVYVIIKESEDDSSTIWDVYDNQELAVGVASLFNLEADEYEYYTVEEYEVKSKESE